MTRCLTDYWTWMESFMNAKYSMLHLVTVHSFLWWSLYLLYMYLFILVMLLVLLLDTEAPVDLELPNQWLWDIIDEFLYQVRWLDIVSHLHIQSSLRSCLYCMYMYMTLCELRLGVQFTSYCITPGWKKSIVNCKLIFSLVLKLIDIFPPRCEKLWLHVCTSVVRCL